MFNLQQINHEYPGFCVYRSRLSRFLWAINIHRLSHTDCSHGVTIAENHFAEIPVICQFLILEATSRRCTNKHQRSITLYYGITTTAGFYWCYHVFPTGIHSCSLQSRWGWTSWLLWCWNLCGPVLSWFVHGRTNATSPSTQKSATIPYSHDQILHGHLGLIICGWTLQRQCNQRLLAGGRFAEFDSISFWGAVYPCHKRWQESRGAYAQVWFTRIGDSWIRLEESLWQ